MGYLKRQAEGLFQQQARQPPAQVPPRCPIHIRLHPLVLCAHPRAGSSSGHILQLWRTSHAPAVPRSIPPEMATHNARRLSTQCLGPGSSYSGAHHESVARAMGPTRRGLQTAFHHQHAIRAWQRPKSIKSLHINFCCPLFKRGTHASGHASGHEVDFSEAKRALCYFCY